MVPLRQDGRGLIARPYAVATIGFAVVTFAALCLHAAERVRTAVLGNAAKVDAAASAPSKLGPRSHQSRSEPQPQSHSEVLSSDEWLSNLRSDRYWSGRRGSGIGWPQGNAIPPPFGLGAPASTHGANYWSDGSYRTVCVRLCDGYFFPISAAVLSDEFEDDEAKCASRCSAPAKLYVYRNGSEEPADMVDLKGQPYSRLKTAFLYRTAYEPSCKCKPHPWEEQATDRHRMYALQAQARKGNRKAAVDLETLKRKVAAHEAETERPGARKAHGSKSRQASKHSKKAGVVAIPALGEEWDAPPVGASANVTLIGPAPPRPKAANVRVIRPGGSPGAAPGYKVSESSRDDNWRKRALGVR